MKIEVIVVVVVEVVGVAAAVAVAAAECSSNDLFIGIHLIHKSPICTSMTQHVISLVW